jgi:hypothetical protein
MVARNALDDEQRHDVLPQVCDDGEFVAVQGCVAEARESVGGRDFRGDEVAVGADDDLGLVDDHAHVVFGDRAWCANGARMP